MKAPTHLLRLFALTLLCSTPVWAAAGTTLTSNSSTAVSLSSGTETINPGVTLGVSGSTVAITVTGSSAITNSGTIIQTGTGRAIRDTTTNGDTLTVTNNAGATITAVGSDAFQYKDVTGTVTLSNSGLISTTHADEGANTTGTGDQGVNWNVLNSDGTVTAHTNVLYNYAGGTISAYEADAVRPGAGGAIYNSGTILSINASDNTSSSDGIDAQDNNTGITIVNGSSLTGNGANLIEGARHGITGGAQTDTSDTAGSSNGNANGIFDLPFTMNITNNANSTIKGDNGSGINLDAVDGTQRVTITNSGLIQGTGVTRDGDGVDVDGVVNIVNNAGATIVSKNAYLDGSEGVTVGGGSITNSGTIEGSTTGSSAYARGITLAGIDHITTNGTETEIPIEKTYVNPFGANNSGYTTLNANGTSNVNSTGTSYVTNNAGGLIKGDTDSGIAILGVSTLTGTALYGNYTAANYAVVITNNAGATIEGAGSVAVIDGSAFVTTPTGTGGSMAIGTASSNNETVIDSGTIKVDGTGKAISLGSGTNSVQILGGSMGITGNGAGGTVSINGDISGGTTTGSNSLLLDPNSNGTLSNQVFSYSNSFSNFNSVEVKSGTVVLSGASTNNGTTTIDPNATLKLNSGSLAAVNVSNGGTLAGNGTVSALAFNPGGMFLLQVNTDGSTGTAGVNWNQVAVNGNLNLSNLSPSLTFDLKLATLDSSNNADPLASFDPTANHVWDDFITTQGFTGTFNSDLFSIDLSQFDNSYNGTFSVVQDASNSNNLDLTYQAAPEPSSWALLLIAAGVFAYLKIKYRREQKS